MPMLPPIDLGYVAQQLDEIGEDLMNLDEAEPALDPSPQTLLTGLRRVLEVLESADSEAGEFDQRIRRLTGSEPELILIYGLRLLGQLAEAARQLRLPTQAQAIECLSLPLSLWMLRRGCELTQPEPAINALAHLANHLDRSEALIELYGLMNELLAAIDLDRALVDGDPSGRPWQVLLLNRAIVATRARQPELMEDAFQAIAEYLPQEAPDFFREGMSQIEALDYPPRVRAVMERYFTAWCTNQRLH